MRQRHIFKGRYFQMCVSPEPVQLKSVQEV